MSLFHEYGAFLSLPLVEQNVNPRVWADEKYLGQAQHAIPVVVKLKTNTYVHLRSRILRNLSLRKG